VTLAGFLLEALYRVTAQETCSTEQNVPAVSRKANIEMINYLVPSMRYICWRVDECWIVDGVVFRCSTIRWRSMQTWATRSRLAKHLTHKNSSPVHTDVTSLILKNLYSCLPSSVQRFVDNERFRWGMPTMFGCIGNLKRNGFMPNAIVDVGAYEGRWTREVKTIYPSVPVLMVEANPEKVRPLTAVQKRLGSTVSFERALLGATARKGVTFYSMETGSSVMPEVTDVPRTPITLDMQTLDDVTSRAAVAGPLLLKLDVQGYELEVLRGSERTLQFTEVIVLELSLLEYNRGAPLLAPVLAEVSSLGYAIYDICGQHRRQASRVLLQMDAIFVRESSPLRTSERF
jgi:FkbM family methyltransferase